MGNFSNLQCCQGSGRNSPIFAIFNCPGIFNMHNRHAGPLSLSLMSKKAGHSIHNPRIRGRFFPMSVISFPRVRGKFFPMSVISFFPYIRGKFFPVSFHFTLYSTFNSIHASSHFFHLKRFKCSSHEANKGHLPQS